MKKVTVKTKLTAQQQLDKVKRISKLKAEAKELGINITDAHAMKAIENAIA